MYRVVRDSNAKTVLHLQIARALRSITQGIAVVDLTLYLKDLHWSGAAIGGVMAAAGFVGAALILMVGILSDRLGRKSFLVVYEVVTAISALLLTFTANPLILSGIIVLTGFGRGQNGAAGPFTPAEQAWMAACVPQRFRGSVFSVNTALGFFGMATGAVLAGAPTLWRHSLPGPLGFHPLFVLMFVISIACGVVIALAPTEGKAGSNGAEAAALAAKVNAGSADGNNSRGDTAPASHTMEAELRSEALLRQRDRSPHQRSIRREENRNMAKLAGVNALNGLAIGFFGPMMSYWFASKFGVSASQIGATLALSFVLAGVSSLVTGSMTKRYGMVKSVVWFQLSGIVLIVLLPFAPSFWLASGIYILRSALSRGTAGARSALSSSLTRDERRGFSVSMNSLAMRLPSSVGPTLSGAMLDAGNFSGPFLIAGGLQLVSTLLYGRLFRAFDEPLHGTAAQ